MKMAEEEQRDKWKNGRMKERQKKKSKVTIKRMKV